jgi:hypothetical protein
VGKARKFFRGHYQPLVPADLGYYDLRVPETRQAQADLAREYGVEGFLYWHYWFGGGKRLLERPFNEVLASGKPDFPFALAWANETWKGFAHGLTNRNVLIEQQYGGEKDYTEHFYAVLPAFKDPRYITVDNKPLFMIYKPLADPEVVEFMEVWRRLAAENGLPGIYFITQKRHTNDSCSIEDYLEKGFSRVVFQQISEYLEEASLIRRAWRKFVNVYLLRRPRVFSYRNYVNHKSNRIGEDARYIPTLLPNWDHTLRSGLEGAVFQGSTPRLFEKHVKDVVDSVQAVREEERFVIIKSWNEWGEGNYMEPDLKWGKGYLEALKRHVR